MSKCTVVVVKLEVGPKSGSRLTRGAVRIAVRERWAGERLRVISAQQQRAVPRIPPVPTAQVPHQRRKAICRP